MCRFKAQITGNSQSISKSYDHKAVHFSPEMHVHE